MTLGSARILGVDIRLDASWVLVALLIAWSLATGVFPQLYAGLPEASYWWMAAATVVGVGVSIISHEMGHTLAARAFGVRVSTITLFVFGGVASMESEPKTARAELIVALMGPMVSVALALAFFALANGMEPYVSSETHGVLHYLGLLNAVLAAFNMTPAFPLDGGRVLRAALWVFTRDRTRATRAAARVGEALAWLMMGLGVIAALGGGLVSGLWWLILGFYILNMARAHRAQAEASVLLSGLRVVDVMTPDPVTAPAPMTVESFVEDVLARHPHDLIPVMDGARVLGGAGFKEVQALARERWAETSLAEIAVPKVAIPIAAPDSDVSEALERMQQKASSRLLVMQGARLVGIVSLKDVNAHLRFRAAFASSEAGIGETRSLG
jgi:Zn-dependent protease/CBS domain-containing protein